MEALRSGQAGF